MNGTESTTDNPLVQLSETDARIMKLAAQLSEANAANAQLSGQLSEANDQLSEVTAHNEQLEADIHALRAAADATKRKAASEGRAATGAVVVT